MPHLLHPAPGCQVDFVNVGVEHSREQLLLLVDDLQHPLLDSVFHHQVDDVDGLLLADAMGPANVLLQLGRVLWQVHVDDHVGRLQVQPQAPSVGGDKHLAVGVLMEAVNDTLSLAESSSQKRRARVFEPSGW